jgi:hypothetical protein
MKKLVVSGMFGLALAASALPQSANAETIQLAPIQPILRSTAIALSCTNPGGSQDVGKQPVIKNTASATIKAGYVISWTSSDGDKGMFKLDADLPVGATTKALGAPGNAYTCNASITPRADLTVKSAQWSGNSSVNVTIANSDTFVDAPSSVVRLEVMSCSGQVLQTLSSVPVAVPKGETRFVNFPTWLPSGKTFLRVTADANKQVSERLETNNILDGMNSCIN